MQLPTLTKAVAEALATTSLAPIVSSYKLLGTTQLISQHSDLAALSSDVRSILL